MGKVPEGVEKPLPAEKGTEKPLPAEGNDEMKQSTIYALLFGFPALPAAVIASVFAGGMVAGGLWLFVFGDNPWPSSSSVPVVLVMAVVFLAITGLIAMTGFLYGRDRQVSGKKTQRLHIAMSAGLTLALVALVFLVQHRNEAGHSEYSRCRALCISKGYSGKQTRTRPLKNASRTCDCWNPGTGKFDNAGKTN